MTDEDYEKAIQSLDRIIAYQKRTQENLRVSTRNLKWAVFFSVLAIAINLYRIFV